MVIPPPKKNVWVSIGTSLAIALLGFGIVFWTLFMPNIERDRLLKDGVQAEGVIQDIEPTGNVYNDQPQAEITILVTLPDKQTYTAKTRMIINPIYAPRFQPGKRVQIRYDKEDRTKIAIESTEVEVP